jgi:hypothetical protein
MGHAPKTIGQKHYTESRKGELTKLFHADVTARIDCLVEEFHQGRKRSENARHCTPNEKGPD